MKIKQTASTLFLIAMLCLGATKAKAQVNAQLFYDFGSDRKFVTLTLEMFKQDKWGNTYFFIDHDFNYDQHVAGPNLAPVALTWRLHAALTSGRTLLSRTSRFT